MLWPPRLNKSNGQLAFDTQQRARNAAPPARAHRNIDACPKCGCEERDTGYGLAFGGGCGVYVTCAGCGELISKTPDAGDAA